MTSAGTGLGLDQAAMGPQTLIWAVAVRMGCAARRAGGRGGPRFCGRGDGCGHDDAVAGQSGQDHVPVRLDRRLGEAGGGRPAPGRGDDGLPGSGERDLSRVHGLAGPLALARWDGGRGVRRPRIKCSGTRRHGGHATMAGQ